MTIRASTIRNIGLNQQALPAPREIRAIDRTTVDARAISGRADQTGALIGESLSALGQFVRLVDERKDEIELLRFGTELEKQVAGLATQARQESERPSDVPQRFLELHTQTTNALLEQVEDPDVRLKLQLGAARQRTGQFSNLVRQVDAEQKRRLNDELNAQIKLRMGQAVDSEPGEARQSIIGEINSLVDRKREHGLITDSEATLEKRTAEQEIDSSFIRAQIFENPSIAVEQLQDPGAFPKMEKARRLAFLEQAVNAQDAERRERIRVMERAEKLEDEAMKALQQENMIDLQARSSDPNEPDPTVSEINQLARSGGLTETQQRIITNSLTSEGGTNTDPFTYIEFEDRINGGEVVPSEEIIQARNDGLLENSEASRLLSLNKSQRDDRITSAKNGLKLRFGAGGLGNINFNRQQKLASALQRFNRLIQASPSADPFDLADQAFKEVEREFQGGPGSEPPSKPATLGPGEVTQQSIQEGMERLRVGVDNDTIGENDAQTQMRLYQEWENFLDAQRRLE